MKCICMYVYLHVLNDNIRVPVIHEFCIPSFRMKDNNFKFKKNSIGVASKSAQETSMQHIHVGKETLFQIT